MKPKHVQDLIWAIDHHAELSRIYGDRWIAILDRQVVASGASRAEVERQVERKTGQKRLALYFVDSGASIYES